MVSAGDSVELGWWAEGMCPVAVGAATLHGAGLGQERAPPCRVNPTQFTWDYLGVSSPNSPVLGKQGWLVTLEPCQADTERQEGQGDILCYRWKNQGSGTQSAPGHPGKVWQSQHLSTCLGGKWGLG